MSTTNRLIITPLAEQEKVYISYHSSSRKTGFWNSLVHLIYTIAANIFSSYEVIYVQTGTNNATYEYVIDKHYFTEFKKGAGSQNDNFGEELGQYIVEHTNNFIISFHTVKHIADLSFPEKASTTPVSDPEKPAEQKSTTQVTPPLSEEDKRGFKKTLDIVLSKLTSILSKFNDPSVAYEEIVEKNTLKSLQTFLQSFQPFANSEIHIRPENLPDLNKINDLLIEINANLAMGNVSEELTKLSTESDKINHAFLVVQDEITTLVTTKSQKEAELQKLNNEFSFEKETSVSVKKEIESMEQQLEKLSITYDQKREAIIAAILTENDLFESDANIKFLEDFESAIENNEDLSGYYDFLSSTESPSFQQLETVKKSIITIQNTLKSLNARQEELDDAYQKFSIEIDENNTAIAAIETEIERLGEQISELGTRQQELETNLGRITPLLTSKRKEVQEVQARKKAAYSSQIHALIPVSSLGAAGG